MNIKYPFTVYRYFLFLFTLLLVLSSCAVYEIQEIDPLNKSANWLMLPLLNHASTPEAGERAADIAMTLLRAKGITRLKRYTAPDNDKNLPELNQQKNLRNAIDWATQQDYQYGLSGSVQEWRYKSGLDAEPVAGITLTVIDLTTQQVIWSASGSQTGWGRDSVSGIAHKLMAELMTGLAITK